MERGYLGARPRPQPLERSSSCKPVHKHAVAACRRPRRPWPSHPSRWTFRTRGLEATITLVASLAATWTCPLAFHGMSPSSHARPSALFPGQASEWPPCGAPVPGSPSCCGGKEDMGLPCAAAGDGARCYPKKSKTPARPRGEALPCALHQEPRVSILPKPLLQKWRLMCPEADT